MERLLQIRHIVLKSLIISQMRGGNPVSNPISAANYRD
jgi:hypothetical protein